MLVLKKKKLPLCFFEFFLFSQKRNITGWLNEGLGLILSDSITFFIFLSSFEKHFSIILERTSIFVIFSICRVECSRRTNSKVFDLLHLTLKKHRSLFDAERFFPFYYISTILFILIILVAVEYVVFHWWWKITK